jgi:hypothetical protein
MFFDNLNRNVGTAFKTGGPSLPINRVLASLYVLGTRARNIDEHFGHGTPRNAVTLKWLPIVFVRLIQSQHIVTVMAKYRTATARLRIVRIVLQII